MNMGSMHAESIKRDYREELSFCVITSKMSLKVKRINRTNHLTVDSTVLLSKEIRLYSIKSLEQRTKLISRQTKKAISNILSSFIKLSKS
jgi:thermostable 8-oxoguanine DNA glycosylase